MIAENKKSAVGFTLIEAIAILVVSAIVGTIVYTFFGDKILKSHVPKENLVKSADLNQVMANIRADYKPYPAWKPNHVYSAANSDKVMPTAFSIDGQRYWYLCTTQGTSGLTEPDPWTKPDPPLTTGVISDGPILKWTYQGALMTLNELKTYIGAVDTVNKKCATSPIPTEKCYDKSTKQYHYYVTENKWIDFDPITKTEINSNNQNILKVTIKNDAGETVTALFLK